MKTAFAGAVVVLGVLAAACSEGTGPAASNSVLASAFVSTPVYFSQVQSSYPANSDQLGPWAPVSRNSGPAGWDNGQGGMGMGMGMGGRDGGHHRMGGDHDGDMMGGGLGPDFLGDGDFGMGPGMGMGRERGFGHGPFGGDAFQNCAFNSSTGWVTCDPLTNNGVTITRAVQYLDANGTPQSAPDTATTNSVATQITVKGTFVHHDGVDTTVVNNASERTVTGLLPSSTQRTVNAKSRGDETTVGTNQSGHFTAHRVLGDTTSGLVVPVQQGHPTYPVAGTIIRSMTATITYDGQAPSTSTRREVITYDGSSSATVVITRDGTTRTCTRPLPRGPLTCQ